MDDQGFDIYPDEEKHAEEHDTITTTGPDNSEQIHSDEKLAKDLQAHYDSDSGNEKLSDYEGNNPDVFDAVAKEQARDRQREAERARDLVIQERTESQQTHDRERAQERLERDHAKRDRDQANKDRDQAKRDRDQANQERDRERSARQRADKTVNDLRDYDNVKENRLISLGLRLLPNYSDIYRKQTMEEKVNDLIKKELQKETTSVKTKSDTDLMNLVKTLIKNSTSKKKSKKKSAKKKRSKKKSTPKKKSKKKSIKKKSKKKSIKKKK